jgi:uncharacterized protein
VNKNNSKERRKVYVYNRTRESFVATEAAVADGYFSRLIGLLGKTASWARPGHGLWIVPSHGVHTIGMLFALDLIFLDRNHVVVHLEEHVRPFCVSRIKLKAHSVLELPPHTIFRTGTKVGDRIEISREPQADAAGSMTIPVQGKFMRSNNEVRGYSAGQRSA